MEEFFGTPPLFGIPSPRRLTPAVHRLYFAYTSLISTRSDRFARIDYHNYIYAGACLFLRRRRQAFASRFSAVFCPLPPYSLIFAVSPFDFVSLAVGFAFCTVFMRRKGDLRDFYTVAAHPIFRSCISARFRRDPHSFPLSVCRKYPLSAPEHSRKHFPA